MLKRIIKWMTGLVGLVVLGVFVAYWMSSSACEPGAVVQGAKMRAVLYCDYGTADVLKIEEVEKPTPQGNEILVKVRAAGVNPLDWHYMRGTPYLIRIEAGLRKPQDTSLGVDFAGTVEAVGSGVSRFKPGDRVFGGRTGAFGEYLLMSEDRAVVAIPANVSFEQAAAVPIAALTALQGLRDKGNLQPGQKVLINGASGGVGTYAVQIAKSMGAEVTGVCSTRNLEMVQSIGADHVVDYTKDDFTQGTVRYDLILDMVGNHSLSKLTNVMTPEGTLVLVGGGGPDMGNWIAPLIKPIKAMLMSPFIDQNIQMLLAQFNQGDLTTVGDLMQAGEVTSVIDRRYSLNETADAIAYIEEGHARGKVIISVE